MNRNLIIGGVIGILTISWIIWVLSEQTSQEPEMVQIDVPNPAFQAGTAPLGENEAETGYLHEDGHRYYNGKRVDVDYVTEFQFEPEEDDGPKIEKLEVQVMGEDGEPLSQEELDQLEKELYQDEE